MRLSLALAALLLCAISSVAQSFSGAITGVQDGNTWRYSIQNQEGPFSPLVAGLFYIQWEKPSDSPFYLLSVTSPPGWSYDTDTSSWIAWFVEGTAPTNAFVQPGETLSGFSITGYLGSQMYPFPQPSYIQAADLAVDEEGIYSIGTAVAPMWSPTGILTGTITSDTEFQKIKDEIFFSFTLIGTNQISVAESSNIQGNGAFSILPPRTSGTYTLTALCPTHLRRKTTMTTGGVVPVGVFNLINGDADGDNEVGPGDFELIVSKFGLGSNDVGFEPSADLDRDEEVGPSDFEIVVGNFGLAGD